ncbi:MAG: hypothetical protein MJ093_04980 [Saccharofermentans sp.]|nr:hypothetical protein [Saccharofermentans sp.]
MVKNIEKSRENRVWLSGIIAIAIFLLIKVFSFSFGDLDELWNFNLARSIADGMVPYRDFNMVMMPLFSIIFSIPLLFSKTLLAYRVMSFIFAFAICFSLVLVVKKKHGIYYSLLVGVVAACFYDVITYNHLMFLMVLWIYYLFGFSNTYRRNYLIGVLAFAGLLSRQSSGVVLLICVGLLVIFQSEKKKLNHTMMYIAGAASLGVVFLIYLLVSKSFVQFWDYCLFSMFSYSSNSFSMDFSAVSLGIIIIVGVVADLISINKKNKNATVHLVLGISLISIAYPLMDFLHISMAALYFLIPIVELIRRKYNFPPYIILTVASLFVVFGSAFSLLSLPGMQSSDIKPFRNIPGSITVEGHIGLDNYSDEYRKLGYDVVYVSEDAVIFSIIRDTHTVPYDLFLKGNMGTKSPLSYIEELCSSSQTIIVIPNDYNERSPQNPEGVYEYISEHCVLVGTYGQYEYYITNM